MEPQIRYRKHKSAEEALKAIKQCHKNYYEKHKEEYQVKEREKYRQAHPGHKEYKKREPVEFVLCQGKTSSNRDCARKVKAGSDFCWQHGEISVDDS